VTSDTDGQNVTNGLPDLSDLEDVLERTRPWSDHGAVERGLREWASRHGWPTLAAGEASVAVELHRLGGDVGKDGVWNARPPDRHEAAEIAAWMLTNVAAGREATEYGLMGVRITGHGIPARTMRRYLAQPGSDPLTSVLRRFAHDRGMANLIAGGRSPVAARAWLRRHPNTSPGEARPPRRRASSPPGAK
jgi:hypothetical protein